MKTLLIMSDGLGNVACRCDYLILVEIFLLDFILLALKLCRHCGSLTGVLNGLLNLSLKLLYQVQLQ